ncbi:hypothetical protein BT69DRAFT_844956 [Atractiella rhizophila]|nr:hypothetical protein BT69DRAFT_844956 [Atractiella rhizophila]
MDFPLVGPRRFLSDPIPGQFSSAIKERMGSRTINLNVFGVFVGMTEDPEVFKHILTGKNWTNFPKGDVFTAAARDFLGVGIFNSDGAQWKHHRTLTRPFFSKEEISNCDVFDKHSQGILSTISRLSLSPLSTSSSIPPQPQLHRTTAFDFQDLASRFTLDSATEFLFGWSVVRIFPHG